MNEIMINRLKKLARSECFHDDEDGTIDDYASGSIDDAFEVGEEAGKVILARDVLQSLGINWSEE
jgi:hypothetical protein